jgi:hypothetical protein
MNRRDFIKGTLASSVLLIVPNSILGSRHLIKIEDGILLDVRKKKYYLYKDFTVFQFAVIVAEWHNNNCNSLNEKLCDRPFVWITSNDIEMYKGYQIDENSFVHLGRGSVIQRGDTYTVVECVGDFDDFKSFTYTAKADWVRDCYSYRDYGPLYRVKSYMVKNCVEIKVSYKGGEPKIARSKYSKFLNCMHILTFP